MSIQVTIMVSPSPIPFRPNIETFIKAIKTLGITVREASKKTEELGEVWKTLEVKEETNEEDFQPVLNNNWDEMSYNCYCQGILEFDPTDEYANGDWNME